MAVDLASGNEYESTSRSTSDDKQIKNNNRWTTQEETKMCLIYTRYHTFLVITHTYNNRIKSEKGDTQNRNKVELMPHTSETIKVRIAERFFGLLKRSRRIQTW